jgi:hypothetical protein
MISRFVAKPPLPLGSGSGGGLGKQLARLAGIVWESIKQVFVSYNPQPEEPDSIPALQADPGAETVAQCRWIYDQAENRRSSLEQKAQWGFGATLFLFPFVASAFLYLLHARIGNMLLHMAALVLLVIAAGFLLLAFISVLRATAVRAAETLFLEAVVDRDSGTFRTYSASYHARGLLRCAVMNTAMNDHIAQFVRGANVLTVLSLMCMVLSAVPAAIEFSGAPDPVGHTVISGDVRVISSDLSNLHRDVGKALAGDARAMNALNRLETRLRALETRLQKANPSAHQEHQPEGYAH